MCDQPQPDPASPEEITALRRRVAELERQAADQAQTIAALRAGEERLRYALESTNTAVTAQYAAERDLQQLNAALEQRVAERTAALEAASAALDASRHFSQRIADLNPAIIYVYDLALRQSVYINPAFSMILGYSLEEIQALGPDLLGRLMHPDDLARLPQSMAQTVVLADHEVFTWEHRMRHADGSWRWLISRDSVFARGPDGRASQILGIALDITERRQAEAERAQITRLTLLRAEINEAVNQSDTVRGSLQACAQAFVAHLDMALARIWLLDDDQETLILAASAGLYTHLDGERGRIALGQYEIGHIALHRQPRLANALAEDPLISDPAWVRREGLVGFAGCPLLVNDRLIGVIGMFARRPIPDLVPDLLASVATVIAQGVERRRSEAALRESEARLRTILEEMPVLLNASNATGTFVAWNRECERVTGYTAAEVIGNPEFVARIYPDAAAREAMITEWARRGLDFHGWELQLIDRSGAPRLIAWSNISDRFPVPGWHSWSIGVEITERKRFERTLQQLNSQLEERVRRRTLALEAANHELESFSYSVSHDLRAPLRAIDGFSQALMEDYADRLDEQGHHYLQRICAGTQRMGLLIDDLLNLSRVARASLRSAQVDLSRMAGQIVADLRHGDPERSVTIQIEPEMQAVGDEHLLRIALENLLANAWKFTGRKAEAHIAFYTQPDPEGPIFVVRDDGAGFDMAYANKLFGAFQRLHSHHEFPGTGIGLATVQRIIHRHGGRIWATGAVEQGATFFFTLPGAADHEGQEELL